jgi:hypothetical protein
MTRTTFLSMFGLGAAGQSANTAPQDPPQGMKSCYYPPNGAGFYWVCVYPDGTQKYELDPNTMMTGIHRGAMITPGDAKPPKPPNGQCPCCGTQAPPFRPVPPPMCGDTMIILESGAMSSLCNKEFLPKRTQVECAHCRVVFGQDAEGER